jgi:hypothetical protein
VRFNRHTGKPRLLLLLFFVALVLVLWWRAEGQANGLTIPVVAK